MGMVWSRRTGFMSWRRFFCLILLGSALTMGHLGAALAAEAVPGTSAVVAPEGGPAASAGCSSPELFDPLSSGYLLKLVLSLVIVLALMFVVVWLLKRTGRFNGRAGSYPLHVLAQMPVGTRERVLLIAVGERQMLLGVSQGHIEPLGWVDPPLSTQTKAPREETFAQLIKNHLPQGGSTSEATGSADAGRERRP